MIFSKSAATIKVISSSVKLSDPVQTHLVVKIIAHSGFNRSDSLVNDIALIKVPEINITLFFIITIIQMMFQVQKEFIVTAKLNFVPMPTAGMLIPAESRAVVSGWGSLWVIGYDKL